MKKLLFLVVFLISYDDINSQIDNSIWHIVNGVKIDFNDSPAQVLFGHEQAASEGIATVTDENGNLLFSVTGTTVYDAVGNVMVNGEGLQGSQVGDAAQSPVVLQSPADPTDYFVFYTTDHSISAIEGDLKYSVLETCTKDGSYRVTNIKNVQIPGNYSERLHAVQIDKRNYWILATEIFQNKLYAFRVDENGVTTDPIISDFGSGFDGQIGKIVVNTAKSTLSWSTTFGGSGGIRLLDFDIETGEASNMRKIYDGTAYGMVWSQNDRYLYFTDIFTTSKVQVFDSETNAIQELDSKVGNYYFGDLAHGPLDDAILVSNPDEKCLDRITNINEGGSYEHCYLSFGDSIDELAIGLQTQVIHYPLSSFDKPDLNLNSVYKIDEDSESINIVVDDEFENVRWSDGQIGNSAIFFEEGIYKVEAYFNCCLVVFEFEILKEGVFNLECGQKFDGSKVQESLLLHLDFEENTENSSVVDVNTVNLNVDLTEDRFVELSSGQFGDERALSFGNNPFLKPNFPMSFSFWVYPEELGTNRNYIYTSDLQLDRRAGFAIQTLASNNAIHFFYSDEVGCYNPACRRGKIANVPLPIAKWTHVVINAKSYDNIDIYYDGCLIPSTVNGSGGVNIHYSEYPSYMGFADNSNQKDNQRSYFGGKLDDFYFWNRSITEEEVLYLYDRFEVPEINLNSTYTILDDQNDVTVEIPSAYTNAIWSDGQTGNSATFAEEGTYQVEAFYDCHLVCEEFIVEQEIIVPPAECQYLQQFDSKCGTARYHCVVNEDLGGPKYYIEGEIVIPAGYDLCDDTINQTVSSIQEVDIFSFSPHLDGHISFRAFVKIVDLAEYESNGLVLEFSICNGAEQACISYLLPAGQCDPFNDCIIDYKGLTQGEDSAIDINYCFYLHDLNCDVNYSVEVMLMNSSEEKAIFDATLSAVDRYECIKIPISIEDFMSNQFDCIEVVIKEDCSELSCSRFDCNFFNVTQTEILDKTAATALNILKKDSKTTLEISSSHKPYPNPTVGVVNLDLSRENMVDYILKSSTGVTVMSNQVRGSEHSSFDISHLPNGIYFLSTTINNQVETHKLIKI